MADYGKANQEKVVDYYVYYSIDRQNDTKTIRDFLMKEQGRIRSHMSSSALNGTEIQMELQEKFNEMAEAMRAFRNDQRRKAYDKKLDEAYKNNMVDMAAQPMSQDLFQELEDMFGKGNYQGVINRCQQAFNSNVLDYRLFIYMAQSYMALNDSTNCYNTLGYGLNSYPDNMEILRAGARLSNTGMNDYNTSQAYINRMLEIDPENRYANSEQCYLYECTGHEDMAYQLMDTYMGRYPSDMEFRNLCAYDLVKHSYSRYTEDPTTGSTVIASQEAYNQCLNDCSKAVSIYSDEYTKAAYENAQYYGTTEFNKENVESIAWMFGGGILYCVCGFIALAGGPWGFIGLELIGALVLYCAIRLKMLSHRPYWQINKYILTGEREPSEKKYMTIGSIFTGYMKWSIRASVKMTKFAMRLAFHR